jgi:hypothetical protein
MKIRLEGGLPFVSAILRYADRELSLEQVLLDTGSGGSVFAADDVSRLGLVPEPEDPIQRIRGVGGTEYVFAKQLDALLLGRVQINAFKIQVGALNYGFHIQGILGMDFLLQAGTVIDLKKLEIRS